MQTALLAAAGTVIIVVVANAWFGWLAANVSVDGGYNFKAATWWIWLLIAMVGFVGLGFALASALGVFIAALKLGLLSGIADIAKGLLLVALIVVAGLAFEAGYRFTIRHRLARILDKGIALGLH